MRKGKTPIVFIPGLFGSMSNIIIPALVIGVLDFLHLFTNHSS